MNDDEDDIRDAIRAYMLSQGKRYQNHPPSGVMSAFAVAIGCKADMPFCAAYVGL